MPSSQYICLRTSEVEMERRTKSAPLGYLLKVRSLELHPRKVVVVATHPAVPLEIHERAAGLTELIRPAHTLTLEEGVEARVVAHRGDVCNSAADPSGDEKSRRDGELHCDCGPGVLKRGLLEI